MAEIRINATGGVKLYDADDSHYAQIIAGTITSNVDAITLGHDTVTIADNLSLGSDSSVLKFGADGDTTLTHTDGTGLTLNSTNKICFNDASQFIQGSSNAILSLGATDEIDLTATAVDLNGTLDVSGATTTAAITASGIIKTDDATEATSTTDGSLQTDGGLSVAKDAIFGDDVSLLSDGAILNFGADKDVVVTHVADTGLKISSGQSSDKELLTLYSTQAGANGPSLKFVHDTASPADDDIAGQLDFWNDNDNDDLTQVGNIKVVMSDASDGTENSYMSFSNNASGTFGEAMRLDQHGNFHVGSTASMGHPHEADNLEKVGVLQTANTFNVYLNNTHASLGTYMQRSDATRAANSAYGFFIGSSGDQSDNEFRAMGDGNVFCDGSFSGGGADYAEFFEWKDGNSSSEDRIGYSVVLDGSQIIKATDSDDADKIIGIISGSPVVVGDTASDKWRGKHLKDDYGRYIWEDYTQTEWTEVVEAGDDISHSYQTDLIPDDVTVPDDATVTTQDENGNNLQRRKVNPDWDKTQTYVPRQDRKEWDTVGLMGKLKLKKGQPTGDRWIKMRDVNSDVEEWLVK